MNSPRLWLLLWVLLMLTVWLTAQERGYVLAIGRVQPTDSEAQACYFPLSNAASVTLYPNGEPCRWMRTQAGTTGKLLFIPDE